MIDPLVAKKVFDHFGISKAIKRMSYIGLEKEILDVQLLNREHFLKVFGS